MTLNSIYLELCNERAWKPRYFIEETLNKLENLLKENKRFVLIARLPTGYGKTTITNVLARAALKNNPYFCRVIHVLPMRSIADDVCLELQKDKMISNHVAVQHLLTPGSPYFAKKCIVTTLDTFLLNFFKIPTPELKKVFQYDTAHSEFPRAMIYLSIVIFDEFHLFAGLGDISNEGKALTSVIASMICLLKAKVPIIIMGATIPDVLIDKIREEISIVGGEVESVNYVFGKDLEFDEKLRKKKKRIHIEEKDVMEILNNIDSSKSVLIVVNTVKKAKEIYNSITNKEEVGFLHGKIPEAIRAEIIKKIKNSKPRILIATQVIEAGVNISYDILITEPCPIDRLIQRAGRVCRFDEEEGDIYISKFEKDYIYDENFVKTTLEVLNPNKGIERKESNVLTFEFANQAINEVYKIPIKELKEIDYDMKGFLQELDALPILTSKYAKELIIRYKGFTENFGIVSCFNEKYLNKLYAIPVSEKEGWELIKKHGKLIDANYRLIDFKAKLREVESLSIYLLDKGYQGIAIPEEEYIEIIGFRPKIDIKTSASASKNISSSPSHHEISKPCAFIGQSLIKHTENTLEKALKMKYSFETMSKRFEALGININAERLEKLIKAACILHDLGKAADEYQEDFYNSCECKGKVSFYLHEVASAYYAYKKLKSIEDYELDTKERQLITLAILFHIAGKNLYDLKDGVKEKKMKWTFNKYWKSFEHLLNKHRIKVDYKSSSINTEEAMNFLEEIEEIIRKRESYYLKLYNLIYSAICVGDNLDSYEFRRTDISESRKIFIEELKEVIANA